MLEVGKNSYVNVEDADAYVTGHYRSNSKDRQRWEGLETEDKEILLVGACAEIELLTFCGRKAGTNQVLAFPRLPMQYGQPQQAPAVVTAAQIELALWLSDDVRQAEAGQRQSLQMQGVQSFSLGDLSESYTPSAVGKLGTLLCPKAARLLSPYMTGGYALC